MDIDFLYIAEGKLYLKLNGGHPRIIGSEFGETTQARMLQIQRKQLSRNGGIMASQIPPQMLDQMREQANTPTPIKVTSAFCNSRGKIYYALNIGEVAGVFTLDDDRIKEKRLYHGSDFLIEHLAINETAELIACSTIHQDGTANIATMPLDGAKPHEITEGDSLDIAPSWLGRGKALVYQSAGIARSNEGYAIDRSPFRIEKLDFLAQDISTLAEDNRYDLLRPQMTDDGTLYYIRRPYSSQRKTFSIWETIKDILLIPWRLANTVYQIVNFFALTFTGNPLVKAGEKKPSEMQKMKVWGDLIDLQKLPKDKNLKEGEAPSLVPNTWELIRQQTDGTQTTIAEKVLYYDVSPTGQIMHTDGNNIYIWDERDNRSQRIFKHKLTEQLTICNQLESD